MQVLEHEQNLEVKKIRTVLKKNFNHDINKHNIYRIKRTAKVHSANHDNYDDNYEDNDDQTSESGTSHRGQHRPTATTHEEDALIIRVIEQKNRLSGAEIKQILK